MGLWPYFILGAAGSQSPDIFLNRSRLPLAWSLLPFGSSSWRTISHFISLKEFLKGFFSPVHSFCSVVPQIVCMVLFPYWFGLARRCADLFQIPRACSTLGTMFRTGRAYKLVKILVSFLCGTILYEEPNVFFVRLFRCSADLFPCAWFCSFTDFCQFPLFFCSA
jgi:hypothetical protein